MSNYNVYPQLGFTEAVKKASSSLLVFQGRSRRSELWWWMPLIILANLILEGIAGQISTLAGAVVSCAVMFLGLAVTVRRVQDTGHSPVWVYASYGLGVVYSLWAAFSGDIMEEYMSVVEKASQTGDFDRIMRFVEANASFFGTLGVVSLLWMIVSLVVVVFTLLDSQPDYNQYGPSVKYY